MIKSDKTIRTWCLIFLSLFVFYACTPSRIVKPLKKGEKAVSASFGGSLIKFSGAPVPLPFTTVAYSQGIHDKVTVFGGLHTTSQLFGNMQLDAGACIDVFSKDKIGVSITPAIQTAISYKDVNSFRLWPSLDWNARYEFTKGYLYLGMHNWFEISKKRAHQESQPHWLIPGAHVGYTITKTKWFHQFELKYMMPNANIYPGVVDYIGINKKGAFGLFYNLTYKF